MTGALLLGVSFIRKNICDPGAQNQSYVAGYICIIGYISQKCIAWVKIIDFSMFHEDILYISYLKYIKS